MDFQHIVNASWDYLRQGLGQGHMIWAFLREGFNQVNALEGLLIALVASLFVPAWKRVFAVALGATLVTIVLNVLLPVLADHAAFRLPPLMEPGFWRFVLVLFLGYLVVISVFFLLKRIFLRSAH